MRHDVEVTSDCVVWASDDASSAKQVASPKPRGIPERPIEFRLLDLESFDLVW